MLVSVIVPCRNEREHIEAFLQEVLRQRTNGFDLEVLVADGGSVDGTREAIERFVSGRAGIRAIDNPAQIVSAGLNAALREARGEVIVRMDVHTSYAEDYVLKCVEALRQTNADNVGGPWVARGTDYISHAIALAFQSVFGSGGARSHDPDYEGPVDSAYLGCWPRRTFERFGLFDESLVRNQDDEHNLRIWRKGGLVWQSPAIHSWYHPRRSLRSLWLQYAQYGYWKVRVIRKHRLPGSVRHLVPVASIVLALVLALLGLAWSFAWTILAILIVGYAVASIGLAVWTCFAKRGWPYFPLLPVVYGTMISAYGCGFVFGVVDVAVRKGITTPLFEHLTR